MTRAAGVLAHFLIALSALLSLNGCGSFPSQAATTPVGDTGQLIVKAAREVVGRPYRYGGMGPQGFDCSGLVYYAHAQAGVPVPRTSHDQLDAAVPVPPRAMQPGDVLFFRLTGSKVSHVGIYAGGDVFIHSPSSGKQVSYASLDHAYWQNRLVGAGRLY